jgi:phosphopantothenoylcysteine decarboxylase
MNTMMWNHPHTARHLRLLSPTAGTAAGEESLGLSIEIIMPIEKTLACGDTGTGAMAAVDTIVERVHALVPSP